MSKQSDPVMYKEAHLKFEMSYLKHNGTTVRYKVISARIRRQLYDEGERNFKVREKTLPFRRELYELIRLELGSKAFSFTSSNKTLFTVVVDVDHNQFAEWASTSLRLAALCVRYEHEIRVEPRSELEDQNWIPGGRRSSPNDFIYKPRLWVIPLT